MELIPSQLHLKYSVLIKSSQLLHVAIKSLQTHMQTDSCTAKPLPIVLLASLTYYCMLTGLVMLAIVCSPVWIPVWIAWMGAKKLISLVMCFLHSLRELLEAWQGQRLIYAILKGNGRYIKSKSEQCYTHQFYDYAARRMMGIAELDSQARIAELQCDNLEGLIYLRQNNEIASATSICTDPQVMHKLKKMQQNQVNISNPLDLNGNTDETIAKYSKLQSSTNTNDLQSNISQQKQINKQKKEGNDNKLDCILLFDHKHKSSRINCSSIFDLLSFCTANLSKDGYIIFGEYLQEGELQVYTSLFLKYRLKVACTQDIHKNIEYAHKLIRRKMGLFGIFYELIQRILNILNLNTKDSGRFQLLILEPINQ